MRLICVILLIVLANSASAKRLQSEAWYQEKYCDGVEEFVLSDRTRVDCLTDEYAIEFEFADKWAEAIGQALHYAFQTNKKAAVYLIVENERKDRTYFYRINSVIEHYKFPVEVKVID